MCNEGFNSSLFKYEDINSSYSSRLYWLNPLLHGQKKSFQFSDSHYLFADNGKLFPFSLSLSRYSRCANSKENHRCHSVSAIDAGASNWWNHGWQYVEWEPIRQFPSWIYILFRFSHGWLAYFIIHQLSYGQEVPVWRKQTFSCPNPLAMPQYDILPYYQWLRSGHDYFVGSSFNGRILVIVFV